MDLLYVGTHENLQKARGVIAAEYPDVKLEDDYDFIHQYRLAVHLGSDFDLDEWGRFMIRSGLADISFFVQMTLLRDIGRVQAWLEAEGIKIGEEEE